MGIMSIEGAVSRDEISIKADAPEARRAAVWLTEACGRLEMPAAQIRRLDHCLDEALANVLAHGGERARASDIRLRLDVSRENRNRRASITVIDAGPAFNPLTVTTIPAPVSIEAAQPGGLGVLLMRSFSDEIEHRYAEGRNHLTFAVCWSDPY